MRLRNTLPFIAVGIPKAQGAELMAEYTKAIYIFKKANRK